MDSVMCDTAGQRRIGLIACEYPHPRLFDYVVIKTWITHLRLALTCMVSRLRHHMLLLLLLLLWMLLWMLLLLQILKLREERDGLSIHIVHVIKRLSPSQAQEVEHCLHNDGAHPVWPPLGKFCFPGAFEKAMAGVSAPGSLKTTKQDGTRRPQHRLLEDRFPNDFQAQSALGEVNSEDLPTANRRKVSLKPE